MAISNSFDEEFEKADWVKRIDMIRTLTGDDYDRGLQMLEEINGGWWAPLYERLSIPTIEYGEYGLDSGELVHIEHMVKKDRVLNSVTSSIDRLLAEGNLVSARTQIVVLRYCKIPKEILEYVDKAVLPRIPT